jgi:hypothetical protein
LKKLWYVDIVKESAGRRWEEGKSPGERRRDSAGGSAQQKLLTRFDVQNGLEEMGELLYVGEKRKVWTEVEKRQRKGREKTDNL